MKHADLHVHTFYSDSTFSPEEVVSAAHDRGLGAIAICDHDCVDGIAPCRDFAKYAGIDLEVIPAIEMTAEKDKIEAHMLGYFIDWKDEEFKKILKEMQESRVNRIYKMVEKLNEAGVKLKAEDVFRISGKGSVGRLHVALAMRAACKIKTLDEAFRKYIGFLKPCYVPHAHLTPRESIELILRMKGVPVLAHPGILARDDELPEFVEYGLRGIEVYHSDHDSKKTKHYEELASRYGLIATGGSDCHGLGKSRVLLGTVRVPYTVVEQLRSEAGNQPPASA